MKQLVQLQKEAPAIKKLNVEVIIVLREDKDEAKGLQKVRDKHKTTFTLLSDLGTKTSAKYSAKRGGFTTYVIDPKGKIRAVLDGSLRKRPTAAAIIGEVKKISDDVQ